MITEIVAFFSNLFRATSSVADAVKQRDGELNAPDIRANASAQTEQTMRDAATKAIADRNLEQIRKDLAE